LIKRRTVAKDVCSGEKVSLNGRLAKPSAEVKIGDVISIDMKNHLLEVRVISTPANIKANEASTIYEVLKDQKKDLGEFDE
jgi:ribosomal 50S subunit-recycling heat shock protein